jgi:hypothetical protein
MVGIVVIAVAVRLRREKFPSIELVHREPPVESFPKASTQVRGDLTDNRSATSAHESYAQRSPSVDREAPRQQQIVLVELLPSDGT